MGEQTACVSASYPVDDNSLQLQQRLGVLERHPCTKVLGGYKYSKSGGNKGTRDTVVSHGNVRSTERRLLGYYYIIAYAVDGVLTTEGEM